MFDGKYFEWNQKRTKGIVDHYSYQFFYGKKVVDLGCGYADISGALYRLGADVTTVDARQEHLKIVTKKFQGIKVVKANLDGPWPFFGKKFDLILDLGLICHLSNFEEHLKAVCASTTHLVIETAVCDSDDPQKCVLVSEGKDVYDLAYNGMGCRPSAAAVERVLTECGMTFKRMDNAKFNVGDYVYDWQPENNNGTSLSKRRIWFASKTSSGVVSVNNLGQQITIVQPSENSNLGYTSPIQNSGIPIVLTASPKPPKTYPLSNPTPINRQSGTYGNVALGLTPNYVNATFDGINGQVAKNSKEFSIITPDIYTPPTTFTTSGVIFPNTLSSKMWMKKISKLFPNISVSNKAFNMFEFNKSTASPNIVMCALGGLIASNRIWIEEWLTPGLSPGDIEILQNCQTIMTPSLINAQEIMAAIPNANVIRVEKAWPMIMADMLRNDYFLYFEKNPFITSILTNSWDNSFGKLIVVGSKNQLPSFAELVLDTADYTYIMSLFMGARAVIDISENNYYMSGILRMAQGLSLPVITNNQFYFNQPNSFLIDQDKTTSTPLSPDKIKGTIVKFMNESNKSIAMFDGAYNNNVNEDVMKLIGV